MCNIIFFCLSTTWQQAKCLILAICIILSCKQLQQLSITWIGVPLVFSTHISNNLFDNFYPSEQKVRWDIGLASVRPSVCPDDNWNTVCRIGFKFYRFIPYDDRTSARKKKSKMAAGFKMADIFSSKN